MRTAALLLALVLCLCATPLFAQPPEPPGDAESRARLICDYVAGMTDRFARAQYLSLVLPSGVPSFEQD